MYAIRATYATQNGAGGFLVRSGNGRASRHAFDHAAGDAAVAAIYAHVAKHREAFASLIEDGARLAFATLPGASGSMDGDTVGFWLYPDSFERLGNVPA